VDVPVTVSTVLTTDEGLIRNSTAQPVLGNITNYAATFMISSFGRINSGFYTCSATVSLPSNAYISDSSTESHPVRVTTGEMLQSCSHFVLIHNCFFKFLRYLSCTGRCTCCQ
jgi:hypothetical protein